MILAQMLEHISYCVLQGSLQQEVSGITEYSGDVKPGMMYCCIRGRHADGHHLAGEAVRRGAGVLIVERPVVVADSEVTVIQVADTKQTAGLLAAAFYEHPAEKLLMIGITGTKGKTTVSYMIQSILQQAGISCGVIGTNGCSMGEGEIQKMFHTTPGACVLQKLLADMVAAGCKAAVLEVSSMGLKEKRCSGIVFDYGIFTNFAPDHIGGAEHSSLEEYLYWKTRLFSQCKKGIVNLEEPVVGEILTKGKTREWIGYRLHPECASQSCLEKSKIDFAEKETGLKIQQQFLKRELENRNVKCQKKIENRAEGAQSFTGENRSITKCCQGIHLNIWTEEDVLGMTFQAVDSKASYPIDIQLPMPGLYNAANALAAITCCLEVGCQEQAVKTALKQTRVPGRTEIVGTFHGAKIIVDYAHNASGLEKLLLSLKTYNPARILCVFGCGGSRSKLRRTEMGEVSSRLADVIVLTEDNSRDENPEDIIDEIRQGMKTDIPCHVVLDRKAAIAYALELAGPGDFVVVAGKGHEDYQEKNGVRYPFSDRTVIEGLIYDAERLL